MLLKKIMLLDVKVPPEYKQFRLFLAKMITEKRTNMLIIHLISHF